MEINDIADEPSFQRGRPPVRNWDLWLVEDKVVTLYEGIDFVCKPDSIRQQSYKKAEQRGGVVKASLTKLNGKAVIKLHFTRQSAAQRVPEATLPPREETGRITDASIDELFYRIHPELLNTEEEDEEPLPVDPRLKLPRFTDDGDMEIDVPARQNPIDDPNLRNGQKWGAP